MKDTLTKLRNLVSMKTTLIAAIQEDLAKVRAKAILFEDQLFDANVRIDRLNARVVELEQESAWWKSLDESMARRENEERSDEVKIDVELKDILSMPDFDLEDRS